MNGTPTTTTRAPPGPSAVTSETAGPERFIIWPGTTVDRSNSRPCRWVVPAATLHHHAVFIEHHNAAVEYRQPVRGPGAPPAARRSCLDSRRTCGRASRGTRGTPRAPWPAVPRRGAPAPRRASYQQLLGHPLVREEDDQGGSQQDERRGHKRPRHDPSAQPRWSQSAEHPPSQAPAFWASSMAAATPTRIETGSSPRVKMRSQAAAASRECRGLVVRKHLGGHRVSLPLPVGEHVDVEVAGLDRILIPDVTHPIAHEREAGRLQGSSPSPSPGRNRGRSGTSPAPRPRQDDGYARRCRTRR